MSHVSTAVWRLLMMFAVVDLSWVFLEVDEKQDFLPAVEENLLY